jgi:cation-transporting ATPase 13A1
MPDPVDSSATPFSDVSFLRPRRFRPELFALGALLAAGFAAWAACEPTPEGSFSLRTTLCGGTAVLAVVLYIALFLSQEWSILARRSWGYEPAEGPAGASHVWCTTRTTVGGPPAAHSIVPLEAVPAAIVLSGSSTRATITTTAIAAASSLRDVAVGLLRAAPHRFVHCGATYEVAPAGGGARVTPLPVPEREALAAYASWRGWEGVWAGVSARFGANRVEVPIPLFWELAREHAVAPFFVFQLVCVALWLLDEYVMMPLFTLSMLTFMEGVLVMQRITTARMLRGMRPPLGSVYVFRNGSWAVRPGEDLIPLDVVSLSNRAPGAAAAGAHAAAAGGAGQQVPCPADVLLLEGTVVVNEAMLTGESTPQLKEAISSLEDAGGGGTLNAFLPTGDRSHTRSIVFAGTLVMASDRAEGKVAGGGGSGSGGGATAIPPPPDGGCPGVVVRTGAYTAQGELMRTIIGAHGVRNTVDRDAFIFLGVMLVFAIATSAYVLYYGLQDPGRDKWKLVLHCIMIITTVIPPELPIQLSLCTNASLAALTRRGIFCTEPTRIPRAGNVNLVAFDKTGTLTADEFTVQAVVFPGPTAGGEPTTLEPRGCPGASRLVMAGCHAIMAVRVELPPPAPMPSLLKAAAPPPPPPPPMYRTDLVGEPLEKAALRALGWTVLEGGAGSVSAPLPAPALAGAPPPPPPPVNIKVLRRWAFSSALRRMTCVVALGGSPDALKGAGAGAGAGAAGFSELDLGKEPPGAAFVVCKGAPEALESLLIAVPAGYTATHSALSASGSRVLTLAFKRLPGGSGGAGALSRESAEGGLRFAGFLVAACALKTDSERTVRELQAAEVRVIMITGDAALTACAVARQLRMGGERAVGVRAFVLDEDAPGRLSLRGVLPGAGEGIAAVTAAPPAFEGRAAEVAVGMGARLRGALPPGALLAVTGRALAALEAHGGPPALAAVCTTALVFARVSPSQKEQVIGVLEGHGVVPQVVGGGGEGGAPPPTFVTAMVGDGSNDTGALKRASLGLAVISNPDLERKYDASRVDARLKAEAAKREKIAQAAKAGPFWETVVRKQLEDAEKLRTKDQEEEEAADLAALLKPERERVQALAPKGEAVSKEGAGGFLEQMVKQAKEQAERSGDGRAKDQARALEERMRAMAEDAGEGGLNGPVVAALGDASMAAPITSKLPTPLSIVEVVRQGRSTLISSHTMFKILAVNSLTYSYTLSVLFLNDVRTGDSQATFASMLSSALFFAISFPTSLRSLSVERPPARVLNRRLVLTIIVQTVMHVGALVIAAMLAGGYEPEPSSSPTSVSSLRAAKAGGAAGGRGGATAAFEPPPTSFSLDDVDGGPATAAAALSAAAATTAAKLLGDAAEAAAPATWNELWEALKSSTFKPNRINTAVWLLTTASQTATFITSYHGPPFMIPLRQASTLFWGTLVVYGVTVLGALGWSSDLNNYFQLVPLETQFARVALAGLIVADGAVSFFADQLIRKLEVPT